MVVAMLVVALVAAPAAQPSRTVLYRAPVFGVKNTTNVLYAQGWTCSSGVFSGTNCTPMDLLLDVYEPRGTRQHATHAEAQARLYSLARRRHKKLRARK